MKISFTDKKLEVCRQIAAEASQQPLEYAMAMGTKFESFVYCADCEFDNREMFGLIKSLRMASAI